MSHGLTVPQGWTRGRKLVVKRSEPPVVLGQEFDRSIDRPDTIIGPNDVAYITFDTKEDAARFIDWWRSGVPAASASVRPSVE